ncbi:MAG: glycosyltransferase, partial [Rhodospirillales bacterium]|nr:glycosyltransferase [Rhodospirillales bacterium]
MAPVPASFSSHPVGIRPVGQEHLENIDVVIPTLNAAATLPATLASLGAGIAVIVADGGSSDATGAVARAAGARVVVAARGRGSQL